LLKLPIPKEACQSGAEIGDELHFESLGKAGGAAEISQFQQNQREEVVVVTMAERQVGIVYRRRMKLCGLGNSIGRINN